MEYNTGLARLWFCAQCGTVIAWPAKVGEHIVPTMTCPTCRNRLYVRPSKRWVALTGDKITHGVVPPYEAR